MHWLKYYWPLIIVTAIAGMVRLICVLNSDLPTGDEINCYISNAQRFAAHGRIPSLSDHPGVSMLYGMLMLFLDSSRTVLPGVTAANIVTVLSGMIAAGFVYAALLHFADRQTAFLASLLLSVFPGCYFAIRGDLSLYFLFLSALLYSLSRLSINPSWRTAMITGIMAGCLYLCRSDGLYVSILTFVMAFLVLKDVRRFIPLMAAAFVLPLGLFFAARCSVMGIWGAGTGSRAFDAFYQAEGLHDGKGGSWQDYSRRGHNRFGPPKQYGNSLARLIISNSGAVSHRVMNNLTLVKQYIRDATGVWSSLVLAAVACVFFDRRLLRMFVLVSLPCILTSCIYLAFYFQRSYFVMLSFGLVTACAAGLSAVVLFAARKLKLDQYAFNSVVFMGIVLASFLGFRTYHSFPGSCRETTSDRFGDSLVFIRNNCVSKGGKFFAFDHAGSRSMYVYAGGGDTAVMQHHITGVEPDAALKRLNAAGVSHILAAKENKELWELSGRLRIVFAGKHDDVRVLALEQ